MRHSRLTLLPEGWIDHGRTFVAHDPADGLPGGFDYGRHWWMWPAFPGSIAAHGYEVAWLPESVGHEGAGDALPFRGVFLSGYRSRSDAAAHGPLLDRAGARLREGLAHVLLDLGLELGADPARVEDHDGQQEHGEGQADEDDRSDVRAEDAGHGQGARGGRHEVVGEGHAAAQRQGEGHVAGLLHPGDGPGERVHDDVAGVAEHRDGDQGAHAAHRPRLAAVAEDAEEGESEGVGGPGHLEDLADPHAEPDHDADRGQGVAEAGGDGRDDVEHRLARDHAGDEGGDEQGHEGVEPSAQHQDDDGGDAQHECQE